MSIQEIPSEKLFESAVFQLIRKELEATIAEEFEVEKKLFNERLDKRKAEIISACTLHVARQIDIQRMGTMLTIRLETKKEV